MRERELQVPQRPLFEESLFERDPIGAKRLLYGYWRNYARDVSHVLEEFILDGDELASLGAKVKNAMFRAIKEQRDTGNALRGTKIQLRPQWEALTTEIEPKRRERLTRGFDTFLEAKELEAVFEYSPALTIGQVCQRMGGIPEWPVPQTAF